MAAPQLPSPNEFLVSAPDGGLDEALSAPSDGVNRGQMLDDHSLVVEMPGEADPRTRWHQLVEQFQSAAWVSPVVMDDGSVPHYPTGDVTVRFNEMQSDDDLERFAASNGLELRSRNEFVAEQVSFRPRDQRGTYLPDLVDKLQGEHAVGAAWLNTRSIYKRA